MRNFATKIDNTAPLESGLLTAAEDNVRNLELEQACSTAAISLDASSGPDSDTTMLAQAMARYASGGITCQDTGAANAYVLSSVGGFVMPKAYFTGMVVRFAPANSGTGAATIAAFGLGAKPLYSSVAGADPASGDIIANRMLECVYFASLNGGGGAFIIAPWSVRLVSLGGSGTVDIYKGRSGAQEQIRAIKGVNGTAVTLNGDVIEVDGGAVGDAGGENNTGANLGAGTPLFKNKTGVSLNFRSLKVAGGLAISVNGGDTEITIDASGILAALKVPFNVLRFLTTTRAVHTCAPGEVTVEAIAYTKISATSLLCVECEISCVPTTTAVPGYKFVNIGGASAIRQASHFSGPDGGSFGDAASESFRAHWAGVTAGAKTINVGFGRVTNPCTFTYNPTSGDEPLLYPGVIGSSYMIYEIEP